MHGTGHYNRSNLFFRCLHYKRYSIAYSSRNQNDHLHLQCKVWYYVKDNWLSNNYSKFELRFELGNIRNLNFYLLAANCASYTNRNFYSDAYPSWLPDYISIHTKSLRCSSSIKLGYFLQLNYAFDKLGHFKILKLIDTFNIYAFR